MMQRLLSVLLVVLCLTVGGVEGQQRRQKGTRRAGSPRAARKSGKDVVVKGDNAAAVGSRRLPGLGFPIEECELDGISGKGFGKKGKKNKSGDNVSPYCNSGLPPETCLICAIGFCLCLDCFQFPDFCDCFRDGLDALEVIEDEDIDDLLYVLGVCWCITVDISNLSGECGGRRDLKSIDGREVRELMGLDVLEDVTGGGASFGGEGGQITLSERGFPIVARGFDPDQERFEFGLAPFLDTEVVWCENWFSARLCGEPCNEGQFCCLERDESAPGLNGLKQVCVDEADETEQVGDFVQIPQFPRIGGGRVGGATFQD